MDFNEALRSVAALPRVNLPPPRFSLSLILILNSILMCCADEYEMSTLWDIQNGNKVNSGS